MRAVIQRVSRADVKIGGTITGEIERGLLVLVAIAPPDTAADGEWLAEKIAGLRIFPDEAGQMNRSVREISGGILVVSQFTLLASTRKGTRPSFNGAASPSLAKELYQRFLEQMTAAVGRPAACGDFGAEMQISLVNEGPVTLIIDSQQRE